MSKDIPENTTIVAHFFRHQSAQMISVLSHKFGLHHIELVEDCVQETMIDAMEQWAFQGIPHKPEAWLMDVAKKKLLSQFRRQQLFVNKIAPALKTNAPPPISGQVYNNDEIEDAQLRMMFACCHPSVQKEAQLALALKTLCGFGTSEIAQALFSNKETVQKQLYRARQTLKKQEISLVLPSKKQLGERLTMVLKTLYVLFNEGYFSSQAKEVVSKDLCFEAIRLAQGLEASFATFKPLKALLAIMFFQFARFEARTSETGALLLFEAQNREQWYQPMIVEGMKYLNASQGDELSSYHLQAGILAEYVLAPKTTSIDFAQIEKYYELLVALHPNDYISLNYAIVLYRVNKKNAAFELLHQLTASQKMKKHWMLYFTLGELYQQEQQLQDAFIYFSKCKETKVPKAFEAKLQKRIKQNSLK